MNICQILSNIAITCQSEGLRGLREAVPGPQLHRRGRHRGAAEVRGGCAGAGEEDRGGGSRPRRPAGLEAGLAPPRPRGQVRVGVHAAPAGLARPPHEVLDQPRAGEL